jgi:hypothetical protein
MFERLDSLCSRDLLRISILITSLFLRLFLPPRLRRLLLFLRRLCPTSILSFYWSALIFLTYYRLGFIGGPKWVTYPPAARISRAKEPSYFLILSLLS